ncbi:hypothetical protein PL321_05335 [Caloramator sp. mosi_1]|uniref:hypothetical protein n=1 Tax=Caloramator sp. mosi_1 TaxID=3023090 RepID=UPI00235FF0A1|nr:hypothetical protein [Caloramator sp. mosi_1]WDC84972.1 hypothetical protein PL321_05335 [Caloramator sp. mosi_1]
MLKQRAKQAYKNSLTKLSDVNYRRAMQQKFGVEFEELDNLPKEDQVNDKVRIIVEVDSPSALELIKQKDFL